MLFFDAILSPFRLLSASGHSHINLCMSVCLNAAMRMRIYQCMYTLDREDDHLPTMTALRTKHYSINTSDSRSSYQVHRTLSRFDHRQTANAVPLGLYPFHTGLIYLIIGPLILSLPSLSHSLSHTHTHTHTHTIGFKIKASKRNTLATPSLWSFLMAPALRCCHA